MFAALGFDEQRRCLIHAIRVGAAIEERQCLVVLRVRDGVVFVRMALRAAPRQPHPNAHRRIRAIEHGGDAIFLVVGSALVVGHRVAMEGGGDELLFAGSFVLIPREQVPRELLARELIEGHVRLERADDPVAVAPHRAMTIGLVSRRVGEARLVEPPARHVLRVVRRSEQLLDVACVSRIGRTLAQQFLEARRFGRQPG
jgi:hypothetical protein